MRRLDQMLCLIMLLCGACATEEQLETDYGVTYERTTRKLLFIPVMSSRERVEVTSEDYARILERREQEHAQRMEERQREHEQALAEAEAAQEQWQQSVCSWILGICLAGAAVMAVLAYVTRQWHWCGGLALILCGIAFAAAVVADILTWIHSWWFAPAVAGLAATFVFCRHFSVLDWVKRHAHRE